MDVHEDAANALELVLRVLVDIGPQRLAACLGRAGHPGQLKHLGLGETARRIGGHRPDNVHHAILDLVVQLAGRSPQLHGRVNLALQAISGLLGDLVAPGLDEFHMRTGRGRKKVVDAQRHLLGRSGQRDGGSEHGEEAGHDGRGGGCRGFHVVSFRLDRGG
ncbi:hypothetical protein D9M69_592120 [compost metagenome]